MSWSAPAVCIVEIAVSIETAPGTIALAHGARRLPGVEVISYNVELKDEAGFVGDRATKRAFRRFIEEWRKPLRRIGQDPFGNEQSAKIAKKKLDDLLAKGDAESAGIVRGAIESFAHELAGVLQRFLKLKSWKDAECLVFAGSRVGELAIGRASVFLKNEKIKTGIRIIRHDPDEAGLIGAAHLAPTWMFKAQMFKAHDAILAVDIGGTNIRAGIVCLNLKDADDLSKAEIGQFELWRETQPRRGHRWSDRHAETADQGRQKRQAGACPLHRHRLPRPHRRRRFDRGRRPESAGQLGAVISTCPPSFTRPSPRSTITRPRC
jgi:hypothetical protein